MVRLLLLFINLLLAAIPSIVLVVYFYRKDRQKPEPPVLIWKTFFAGFLAVIPAAVVEQVFGYVDSSFSGLAADLIRAFGIAGLVEEGTKLAVVRVYVYPKSQFDEIADGIVYTITAGLGFAFFENILYSFGPTSILIMRGVTAVPLHAVSAGILGYYIGLSKFGGRRVFAKGLAYAVLIHGIYDYLLFTGSWAAVLVLPLLYVCFRILQSLYRKALAADRAAGRS